MGQIQVAMRVYYALNLLEVTGIDNKLHDFEKCSYAFS